MLKSFFSTELAFCDDAVTLKNFLGHFIDYIQYKIVKTKQNDILLRKYSKNIAVDTNTFPLNFHSFIPFLILNFTKFKHQIYKNVYH